MTHSKTPFSPLSALSLALLLSCPCPAFAVDSVTGALVQTIDTSQFNPPSPDSSDIAYNSLTNTLLVCDGEVDEMSIYQGANLFEMTLYGTLLSTDTTAHTSDYPNLNAYTEEPVGCTFNPLNGHLFIASDDQKMIFEINPGDDGRLHTADDIRSSFSTLLFGSNDPEGIAYNPVDGALYIADGVSSTIYRILPGANGSFDGVPPSGDDVATHFDTMSLGIKDPEGIAFEAENRLYIVGKPASKMAHVYTSGPLIRMVDISAASAKKPSGLAVAPASADFSVSSVYLSDRGVDNHTDPNENDGKVYELSVPPLPPGNRPPGVTAGPDLTVFRPAGINLNGALADDILPPEQVTATWSQISGPDTFIFENPNAPVTAANSSTDGTFVLRLTANDGTLSASDEVTVQIRQPFSSPFTTIYLSTAASTTVNNMYVGNEDIIAYDTSTGSWAMFFDGSDVGLDIAGAGLNVNAFKIMPDDTVLLSFNEPITLPITVGDTVVSTLIDDSDIVRFVPTSLGVNTAGHFQLYFQGASAGLDQDSEDIDAIGFLPDGRLVISTIGNFDVPGVSGKDDDLIILAGDTWQMHLKGSDVGLFDGLNNEDINGIWIDDNNDIYLTTAGDFSVPGVTGDGGDIFRCRPGQTGNTTTCSYDFVWDGRGSGLPVGVVVDGIEMVNNPSPPAGGGTNLSHQWNFDETSGTVAADSAGTNNATLTNVSWVAGNTGNATAFNGTDASGDAGKIDFGTSNFTVAHWVKVDDFKDFAGIFNNRAGIAYENIGFHTRTDGSGTLKALIDFGAESRYLAVTNVVPGTWYHVAVSVDRAGLMKLYVNGVLSGQVDISDFSATSLTHPENVRLGRDQVSNYFNGAIDELRLYNSALSAEEILNLYLYNE